MVGITNCPKKINAKLTPFKQAGIIRVGGRVDESDVSYDEKHPILLPKNHWFSTLIVQMIVQHTHQFGHPATQGSVGQSTPFDGKHAALHTVALNNILI